MDSLARRGAPPATVAAIVVASWAAVLGCMVGAGELLTLVERSDGSTAVDSRITAWVVAHRTGALTTLARVCSDLGSSAVLLPLVVILVLGLLWRRQVVLAVLLVLAYGGSVGLYNAAKAVVGRERPPAHLHLTAVSSSSFPSGHATQSLATYAAFVAVIVVLLPRLRTPARVLAVALAVGVGWSRVYLGVHWATDVVVGWLAAAAWIIALVWRAGPMARAQAKT